MKTILLSTFLLAVLSSPAFGSENKLPEWLDTGSWAEGVDYCDHRLVDDLSQRSDLRDLSAAYLSRLAVYCSALASGKGDEAGSGWWWYTAASLDLKAAESLLSELRKKGFLQTLPAPRSLGPASARGEDDKKMVRLPSGENVPGTPPRPLGKQKIPSYMFHPGRGVVLVSVAVEVVISKDGVPRQPLLVEAHALPAHVLFAYQFLRGWRFEPAKVNGEPVECLYRLTVSTRRT
ncbi:MAG TPA: hypothetical protein VH394_06915 [Thermoanaerobaculia bacterium]|jgi:hypothetical protein|nr:hypothetical protein [Thermoanaerobaculia bacterium]